MELLRYRLDAKFTIKTGLQNKKMMPKLIKKSQTRLGKIKKNKRVVRYRRVSFSDLKASKKLST